MKDSYLRIRCSEQDKALIQALAEQNGMNMSEYLLSLVQDDKQYYHEVEVYAVVRGSKKGSCESIEKHRTSLGNVLVDKYNRVSVHTTYKRLMKEANGWYDTFNRYSGEYLYLEVDGERVSAPATFSDWVVFGKEQL